MKGLKSIAFFFIFLLASCAVNDEDSFGCVTFLDCPPNHACVDSVCVLEGSNLFDDSGDSVDDFDDSGDSGNSGNSGDSGDSSADSGNSAGDSDEIENGADATVKPDEDQTVAGCPNDCSNFGECDPDALICICNEFHKGEDCSECVAGYHMESEDDDENGDGLFSCVKNRACIDNPCNGHGCKDSEFTAICTCRDGYVGRWCNECEAGYLMSKLDGTCKRDCETGDFNCEANKKCSVDEETNEAGCNLCAEGYSGEECELCDVAHFCSGHAESCLFSGSGPVCACLTGWVGTDCSACDNGFVLYNENCVKDCDPQTCFKEYTYTTELFGPEIPITITGHGACDYSTGSGQCKCDQGWKGKAPKLIGNSLKMVECENCDKSDPPPEFQEYGCKAQCSEGVCENGSCYYEKTGDNKIYCVCNSGFHLNDGGDKYNGTCVSD